MRRFFFGIVLLLSAALIWAGGQQAEGSSAAARAQEIKVAASFFSGAAEGDMAELDPARRGTWSFHALVWAPLVAGDTAGNFIPEKSLATKWEVSPDGRTYTFHLRDAKFSDGTPITAKNVVDCFGHWGMLQHAEARGYRDNFAMASRLLPDVVDLAEFVKKYPYDEFGIGGPIEGIKTAGDKAVQITLKEPSVTFIRRLMVTFSVFKAEDLLAGKTANYDLKDYWPAYAVSAGPYKISEAVAGEKYVLVPNENYFGPKPRLQKITVLAIASDMNTILTVYQNDEIDMVAMPITGDAGRQAMGDPSLARDLVKMPMWQVSQLWATPNVPLDDVNVRRAFSMAIDKDRLVSILNAGAPQPLYERVNTHRNPAVPDAIEETAAVKPLPFDPAMAMKELQKSPYWPGVLDMEIHLYAPNPSDVPLMETVQKMLTDNLGLKKVTIHNQRISDMMNPPFPIHLWYNTQMPWVSDIVDTLKNMAWLMPEKPWQPGDHRPYIAVAYEPELRKLVDAAFKENDPKTRSRLIADACQMWNDVAFSLDFAVPVAYYLIKPHVKGFEWYQNAGQGLPLNIEKAYVE